MPDLRCLNCRKQWSLKEEDEDTLHTIPPNTSHIAQNIGIPLEESYTFKNSLPFLNSRANCCKSPLIYWILPTE